MTAPHLNPPQSGTTERRRTLRAEDRPDLDDAVLTAFRAGRDTYAIAATFGLHESIVVRALHRARAAERARTF